MRLLTLLLLMCLPLLSQSGVSGSVPFTLVDGGTDCNGLGRLVEIYADPSGLTGNGGAPVGLNGYRLVIQADRPGILTSVMPGSVPIGWQTIVTAPPLTTQVLVAGWSTDINAPNHNYHLATLILTGTQGPVTLSLISGSELASRLVALGNGPELLNAVLPSPLTTSIPANYNLSLLTGFASWQTNSPSYDLAAPGGDIDIRDLVKLILCTP